ncbi:hypothetical protein Bca101_021374 [Brassica carinata]
MRILSWNCQGLGNTPTVRQLQEIHRVYSPDIIFLSETKNKRWYLEDVMMNLGFHDLRTVEPVGKSGGLAVFWKNSCRVEVLQSNRRLMDLKVTWKDKTFFLTGVYGEPVKGNRNSVWERLTRIGVDRREPWFLTGDFNEIVDQSEKQGGALKRNEESSEFRQMIKNCGLWEIQHKGFKLSWHGIRNNELVQCRLDRSIANQAWLNLFPQASARYLSKGCSDHSPVMSFLDGVEWRRRATFRYDQRWIKREGFTDTVKYSWSGGANGQFGLMQKISNCRQAISIWKKSAKPNSAIRIQELHHRIDIATHQTLYVPGEISLLRKELSEEYYNEEIFWKQKSRLDWLKAGDMNTKFFHATTKNRRAQNHIHSLVDANGKEWFEEIDLGRIAEDYFKSLFASEDVGIQLREWEDITPKISQPQNEELLKEVTVEEVKRAVFETNPQKCPGPDGMSAYFYQHFWESVGGDLTEMVKEFFRSGKLEEGINKTSICLIPKKLNANRLADFRPISLCNVVFKIITKILAKRLKKILPLIISETQAAFIEGRIIQDNILLAHELLHALNSNNKCSEDFIAVKTDISKAYDRVEWSFLRMAMKTLGFSEQWCELIMACVTSAQYQVLINGTPYGEIKPSRGLRQGDPISPYLFVICTEMLVQMLSKAEEKKYITGLKVARGAPPISHLLYADDSLFYCQGSEKELDHLNHILSSYSLASGQRINYQKSSIYFGKNVSHERRVQIKEKLGIDQEGGEGVYLGLPEAFGGSKVSILSYLKERMSERVQGWQTRFLSPAGKEVMLKAVALALPTYTMSCFLLPKTVCKKIISIMSGFWWRNKKETRGIYWKSWEQLSKPKDCGGLGFKDIEAFNLALLGKQLWRILSHKDSLLSRVFKSRYFAKADPLSAGLGSRPSYAWRSIYAAQKLIQQGARVLIGNGENTKVFQDSWIDQQPARRAQVVRWNPENLRQRPPHNLKVRDLLVNQGREWNLEVLSRIFPAEEVERILKIRTCGRNSRDVYIWDYNKTGAYTVKSGYWVLTNILNRTQAVEVSQPSRHHLSASTSIDTSPKIHHFLWRCISNSIRWRGISA